jgi:hypothetical protein
MKHVFAILAIVLVSFQTQANQYQINDANIDAQFEQSESLNHLWNVSLDYTSAFDTDIDLSLSAAAAEKSQKTAALIAFGSVLVPWVVTVVFGLTASVTGVAAISWMGSLINIAISIVPWHRFYLGTGGENLKIWALYCVTFRWCGVLPIIDGIMLLMDDSGEKYYDNPKYLMWLD